MSLYKEDSTLNRLYRRLINVFGKGRLTYSNDSGDAQMLQARFGGDELIDKLPRFSEFGFTSVAPLDSEVLAVFVAGDRSNAAVIASHHSASRPKNLNEGETAIFNQVGIRILLGKEGLIIDGAGLPVTITGTPNLIVNASDHIQMNTPTLTVSGDIQANGNITDQIGANGKSMASMRQLYNGHNHQVSGVQSGAANVVSDHPGQQA
ncbi:phage baseplate assembly protein V [Herbaspirillum chlorophenolicum]|uniref:phage baseplate assembly protein V n=1 Tax=Herbaspirillum chlorophenolicum TaxID=211589 RepID=UPI00067AD7E2|nr:phage baseplate assembly protein V [Herbaspirillum chlorophenolicum]